MTLQQRKRTHSEGDYGVIIQSAYEDATREGTSISIYRLLYVMILSSHIKMHIFGILFGEQNPTDRDKTFGGYLSSQLLRVCQAVGIPSDTRFEDLTALLDTLSGKLLRVKVKHNEV